MINFYRYAEEPAYFAIRSDDQLENRFEPFTLPLWKDDAEFASLLASITSTLPLRKPSTLTAPEVTRFILDKCEGTIGEIITLLTKAAILAIESGEEMINKKILARIDYLSPNERRRAFERDLIRMKFSTSTITNENTIVPWLAAEGPLAYSPLSPPTSDYFFLYNFILPWYFQRKCKSRQHDRFGDYSGTNRYSIYLLKNFWEDARSGRVNPIFTHEPIGDLMHLRIPIAVFNTH